MSERRNECAVSYDTGREFAKAASEHGATIHHQDFAGAKVAFFDTLARGEFTRHYHLTYHEGSAFDVRLLHNIRR